MNISHQQRQRAELAELHRRQPNELVAKYREVAHMKPDETLPMDVSFSGMIDAIVAADERRRKSRWK